MLPDLSLTRCRFTIPALSVISAKDTGELWSTADILGLAKTPCFERKYRGKWANRFESLHVCRDVKSANHGVTSWASKSCLEKQI